MEMSRESSDGRLRQVDGLVRVQCAPDMPVETAALYRDLAVLCIEKQIRRVLVTPADDDPVAERSLRSALTTMVLAGLPAEFRVAVVAQSTRIVARYRNTERDLCAAGVETKLFDAEDATARWLDARR